MSYTYIKKVSHRVNGAGVEIRIQVDDPTIPDTRTETLQFSVEPSTSELTAAINNKLQILNAPPA